MKTIFISSLLLFSCGKFESVTSSVSGQDAEQTCKQNVCEARLSWTGPSAMLDGTPLPGPIKYFIYWGTSSGVYPNKIDNGTATTGVVSGLATGVYYFVVTAYLTADVTSESAYSAEVSAVKSADMRATEIRLVLGH